MNRQFWNDGYKKGIDYRQISDEELEAILSKFPVKPNSALDIGCGIGELSRQLNNQSIKTTAIDLSDEAILLARQQSPSDINFIQFDVESDSLESLGNFDLITMKLVFKFIQNKSELINNLHKILNKDGYLVITNTVVTNFELAPAKIINISVDDDMTMNVINFGFILVEKITKHLSDYHNFVTYIFKKENLHNFVT